MSTGEKGNILDYLPEQHKRKVLELVKRLKQETEVREKYQGMYGQSQQELNLMTLKYNQLKDQNKLLKEQIHNSFSIVSQVRANFHANRQKNSEEKVREDKDWEDQSDQQNQQNDRSVVNQSAVATRPTRVTIKSPLEKYRPPMTTSKKPNLLNLSSNEMNLTQMNSNRSKQITDLKKEIRSMQEQKRRQSQKKKEVKEKIRLVDEIKNRYKSGEDSMRKSTDDMKETIIERIDISNTFESQDTSIFKSKQKSKGLQSNQKPSVKKQASQRPKPVHTKYKSPGKGHVITAEDYDDVLDLINCHNL